MQLANREILLTALGYSASTSGRTSTADGDGHVRAKNLELRERSASASQLRLRCNGKLLGNCAIAGIVRRARVKKVHNRSRDGDQNQKIRVDNWSRGENRTGEPLNIIALGNDRDHQVVL
eukprot:3351561-Pleurochrysis_carterae.AAC.3